MSTHAAFFHKTLLAKYIAHIKYLKGGNYLGETSLKKSKIKFTGEELRALKELEEIEGE